MRNFVHCILSLFIISTLIACSGDLKDEEGDTLNSLDTAQDSASKDSSGAHLDSTDTPNSDTNGEDAPASADAVAPPPEFLGGDQPAPYYVPDAYDPQIPMPILVLLHGYTSKGSWTADWWKLYSAANEAGILLVVPEAKVDAAGNAFWNATDFCCDFYATNNDDVGYITGLIEEAKTYFSVDSTRVYLMGHSNGGFMSHRIACDHPDLVTAIINVAGATWYDPQDCTNPEPVSVLQVHGTWDLMIYYGGLLPNVTDSDTRPITQDDCLGASCAAEFGACSSEEACAKMMDCFLQCSIDHATNENAKTSCNDVCWQTSTNLAKILWMDALNCGLSAACYIPDRTQDTFGYASAEEGAARWAQINGCEPSSVEGPPVDLEENLPGPDTYPMMYEGCPAGLGAGVWKILYGGHNPTFNDTWGTAAMDWLLAQQKPTP